MTLRMFLSSSTELVQFDTQDPYEIIHHFEPVAEIPELTLETYVPRASTPLLDAIGRGVEVALHKLARTKLGEHLTLLPQIPACRPTAWPPPSLCPIPNARGVSTEQVNGGWRENLLSRTESWRSDHEGDHPART